MTNFQIERVGRMASFDKKTVVLITENDVGIIEEVVGGIFDKFGEYVSIVVVDNCSDDGTMDYLRNAWRADFRFCLISLKIRKQYAELRNIGLNVSDSERIDVCTAKEFIKQTRAAYRIGIYRMDGMDSGLINNEDLIIARNKCRDTFEAISKMVSNVSITIYHTNKSSQVYPWVYEVIIAREEMIPTTASLDKQDVLLFLFFSEWKECLHEWIDLLGTSSISTMCWLQDKIDADTASRLIRTKNIKKCICSPLLEKCVGKCGVLGFKLAALEYASTDCENKAIIEIVKDWLKVFEEQREKEVRPSDYQVCTVNGLSYIASCEDSLLLPYMMQSGKNHAQDEMQAFYELSHKYYDIDCDKEGYFLDLGANIGSTSIYFKKHLDKNIRVIAFEPAHMTYNLLRVNMILNDMYDEAVLENLGLSDKESKAALHCDLSNPGGNSLILDVNHGNQDEQVALVALDSYVREKHLDIRTIKYVWIDVEGFEPFLLAGGFNTFKSINVPIQMEFSPFIMQKAGVYEKMMHLLKGLYKKYVVVQEFIDGKGVVHDISELWDRQADGIGVHMDLFLLK